MKHDPNNLPCALLLVVAGAFHASLFPAPIGAQDALIKAPCSLDSILENDIINTATRADQIKGAVDEGMKVVDNIYYVQLTNYSSPGTIANRLDATQAAAGAIYGQLLDFTPGTMAQKVADMYNQLLSSNDPGTIVSRVGETVIAVSNVKAAADAMSGQLFDYQTPGTIASRIASIENATAGLTAHLQDEAAKAVSSLADSLPTLLLDTLKSELSKFPPVPERFADAPSLLDALGINPGDLVEIPLTGGKPPLVLGARGSQEAATNCHIKLRWFVETFASQLPDDWMSAGASAAASAIPIAVDRVCEELQAEADLAGDDEGAVTLETLQTDLAALQASVAALQKTADDILKKL